MPWKECNVVYGKCSAKQESPPPVERWLIFANQDGRRASDVTQAHRRMYLLAWA
jgi:hypothetical protein